MRLRNSPTRSLQRHYWHSVMMLLLTVWCLRAYAELPLQTANPLNTQLAAKSTLPASGTALLSFELKQPQYIRAQAIGTDLTTLTYYNAQGQAGQTATQTPLRLERLALPAGKHYLELKGTGAYVLKVIELGAVPLGTPYDDAQTTQVDASACIPEPTTANAEPLLLTLPSCLQGTLDKDNTHDTYLFKINETLAKQSLTLNINITQGEFLTLALQNSQDQTLQSRTLSGVQTLDLSPLVLAVGDYTLKLQSVGHDTQYTLTTTLTPQPSAGFEVEPNDYAENAAPLDKTLTVQGQWKGDEFDHYTFNVSGAPQLWQLEVVGKGAQELRQYDNAGAEVFRRSTTGEGIIKTKNVLLLPGRTTFAVKGDSSDYTFKALALGPPNQADPNRPAGVIEQEPNDTNSQAELLNFNSTRVGLLAESEDWDSYYFTLHQEEPITLTVTPGANGRISRFRLDNLPEATSEVSQPLVWTETLKAGTHYLQLKADPVSDAHYQLRLTRPEPKTAPQLALKLTTATPQLAAFWTQGQSVKAELTLTNTSSQPQTLNLTARTSHSNAQAILPNAPLELAANSTQTVPVTVKVLPDLAEGEPLRLTVAAHDTQQQLIAETSLDLISQCDAPPIDAQYIAPLPTRLLGGFNLAAAQFGAKIVGGSAESAPLIDGKTSASLSWEVKPNDATVIELAQAAPIQGFVLNPASRGTVEQQLKAFEIALSDDGQNFTTILTAQLNSVAQEQAFELAKPTPARFVKLTALNNHEQSDDIRLGELKVIASPTLALTAYPQGFNLADPVLGGYLVMTDPLQSDAYELLNSDNRAPAIRLPDAQTTARWVVGLQQNRAAQIQRLSWTPSTQASSELTLTQVKVEVSLESPVGPWRSLGDWDIKQDLVLPEPTWARFVRFTVSDLQPKEIYRLADALKILERPVSDTYYSILGEWGENQRQAGFEYFAPVEPITPVATQNDANEQAEHATSLLPDQAVHNQVTIQKDVDWYKFKLDAAQHVTLAFNNQPNLRIQAQLYSAQQQLIPVEPETNAQSLTLAADLEVGEYWLKVTEPPRSVVFSWDNSGSMATYNEVLYRAITRFAQEVNPEVEAVQLMPFSNDNRGRALLEDWSGEPTVLMMALNNYSRTDSSSGAEGALLSASELLAKRQGSRAVLLLTDAESSSYEATSALWQSLEQVKPSVYSLQVDLSYHDYAQDLMQSWADVGGGYYSLARSQADLALGFARASCQLRRAAPYQLTLHLAAPKPKAPTLGSLTITSSPIAASAPSHTKQPTHAIEIILDASGSMLEKVGKQTKISIAKNVLTDLVQNTLPASSGFALRVYGHKDAGCRTDLEIALNPLDRTKTQAVIKTIKPQLKGKTPLADSILKAGTDLKGSQHATLILLTDGKESCGGSVPQAIEQLKAQNIEIKLSIIGLGIDEAKVKQEFKEWAKLGGGHYLEASNSAELKQVFAQVVNLNFEVMADDKVIATGQVNGQALTVPTGVYTIRFSDGKVLNAIEIKQDVPTTLVAPE